MECGRRKSEGRGEGALMAWRPDEDRDNSDTVTHTLSLSLSFSLLLLLFSFCFGVDDLGIIGGSKEIFLGFEFIQKQRGVPFSIVRNRINHLGLILFL